MTQSYPSDQQWNIFAWHRATVLSCGGTPGMTQKSLSEQQLNNKDDMKLPHQAKWQIWDEAKTMLANSGKTPGKTHSHHMRWQ